MKMQSSIKKENFYELIFDDNLQVMYKNEPVDSNYRIPFKKANYNQQESIFLPVERPVYVDKHGNLLNPLLVFFEGYWAFEKFAFTLPLDYVPQIMKLDC
ncbi:MAG: hypothetical protein HC798_00205 [Polaribacter sp.]|nr:hypothetical protein [Polaribacter sp.]